MILMQRLSGRGGEVGRKIPGGQVNAGVRQCGTTILNKKWRVVMRGRCNNQQMEGHAERQREEANGEMWGILT
jgi:hypothetical protein